MIDVTFRKLLKAFEDFRSRNEEYKYQEYELASFPSITFRSYDSGCIMKFFEHKKTLSASLQDKTSLKIHWKRFYDQTAATRMRENHLHRQKSLKNYLNVDILWQVVSK